MKGLLSADNALGLAVMVKHLPEKMRKKALFYGLDYYKKKKAKEEAGEDLDKHAVNTDGILVRMFGMFCGTVIAVEIMDIAFSVDSVLAAFAISEQIGVLFLGGILEY